MARHRLGGAPTPPSWLQQYAKAICGAIVAAGGTAAAAAAEGGISLAEGCLIAVTFFGTLGGVATVRNVMTTGQLLQQPVYRIAATGGRKMLGRRAPKHAPALMLGDFLTAVPAHPITDLAPNLSWPMDHNDEAGDCVVAGLDHALQAICAQLGVPRSSWSDSDLLALYRTQNPSFRSWGDGGTSRDNGMDVQTFLEYLVKQGVLVGFAKVDHTNLEQMKAAAYLGLAVVTGEVLTTRNMSEQVWDYHPGDPDEGGHCVAPGTRVLTDDLRWVPVEDVLPGEGLLGFDEHSVNGSCRRYLRTVVEAVEPLDLPCYDLTFDDGTTVRCSADHLWFQESGWVRTDRMRVLGDGDRASRVRKPFSVWETDESRDAGYLAAAFDGEGHLGTSKGNLHRLGFAQRDNAMWECVTRALKERDFIFSERQTALGGFPGSGFVRQLNVGHRSQVLRFLGSIRPHRLLENFRPNELGRMHSDSVRLVKKEFVGTQRVIALQTDARTFFAEGLASHNCTVNVGYDPRERQVSWGALYAMTDAFLRNNVEEAWFIVTQAHVDHPGFRAGFDLQAFAAAYTAITGRPFPAVVTPPVDPPQPQPAGGLVLAPPQAVLDALAVKASHSKTWPTPQAWAEHALEQAVKK
jgi:hypothetical protein